jgi:tRNA threonylcarbamoyladenosine biosynthesis protein TsaE
MRIALTDIDAAARLGAAIAERLRPGDVVALTGGLGAGKTTLARAIITALGHTGEVPSPTFTIIEIYAPPEVRLPVVHADFYRLADPAEARELGLDEYREDAVLIAEWPEQAGGFAHEPGCLSVRLDWTDEDGGLAENGDGGRIAVVEGGAEWLGRMPNA